MRTPLLRYRAGRRARARLQAEGLQPNAIRGLYGPASGPKWLILAGIDQALLQAGWQRSAAAPWILAGASAGAWRMAALACADAETAHRELQEGYIRQTFTREDSPATIGAAYDRMLAAVFHPERQRAILARRHGELRVHVCEARTPLRSQAGLQLAGMVAALALNPLLPTTPLLVRRRIFGTDQPAQLDPLPLTTENLLPVLRSSGTLPVYMDPVTIPGRGDARHVDGGLSDYHLASPHLPPDDDGLLLLPHYRPFLRPAWLDRSAPWRRPAPRVLDNVLLIHPDPTFVAALPGGRIPDRHDFRRYVDDPEGRIRQWTEAAKRSELLGAALLEDIASGRIADHCEPL